MRNIVGKTIKIKGYQGSQLVGVIATLDVNTRTGIFVGYLNRAYVGIKDIKDFKIEFNGNRYETEQQYVQDLREGKLRVNEQDVSSSRMPKELGDVIRARATNIQKVLNRRDGDIVINLAKQKEYRENVWKEYLRAIKGDSDLGSYGYEAGEEFISNKGFYFIKKSEVSGLKKEQLEKLSTEGIRNLGMFSQNLLGGSSSDYYVYALWEGFKDYYLYVEVGELDILDKIRDNIRDSAVYPEKMSREVEKVLTGYQRLPVTK